MKSLEKILADIKENLVRNRQWINKNFKVAETGKFSLIPIDGKHFKLFPGPEFSSELYRGQTTFYEQCIPNIYRDKNQIKKFIAQLRTTEFKFLLKNHPALLDIKELSLDNRKLKLDFEGMAQHYGLLTELLDFTSDLDIALFFATNDYMEDKNIFKPVLDKRRIGIIYKYNH
ncbi:MAG: FRG domain-containing protein [Ignavibacteria bacterium]|nr:FRG domain-containing protein [Ignavibacteria bacterium]